MFHLPAQAAAGHEASFFHEHNWDAPILSPYEWVDRSIVDHRPPTIPRAPQTPSEAPQTAREDIVAEAEAAWQGHAPGTGNHAFFKLAAAYRRAGLDWFSAEAKLREQAAFAHSATSRRDRLHDMRNFRRKLWR
jgi:hypothetical protein